MRHKDMSRKGLTLLELVVVLTILVALGGILVPVLGNFLTRSHAATCSTNIPELSKAVLLHNTEKASLPNRWQTGIALGAIPAGQLFQGSAALAAGDIVNVTLNSVGANPQAAQAYTLVTADVDALTAAGITAVLNHGVLAENPTFDIAATEAVVAVGTNLITLSNRQARDVNLPHDNTVANLDVQALQRYVWLGFGPENTLFGNGALEAAVMFGDDPDRLPTNMYSRFGAVVQLANDNGVALETAKFKRVTYSVDGLKFETVDSHVKVFYEDIAN
jgi:Tfp pilus assembly protein PilE